MKNTLKAELYKAFHNKFFWISFVLMTSFAIFGVIFMEVYREQGFEMWREYRFDENGNPIIALYLPATSLYCKWLGGDAGQFTTGTFYFLTYLVCTVPFSWSLVSEKQSGYEVHMVLNAGKGSYYLSKYIASFISGAFVIVVPLVVNFILSACFVPAFFPEPYAQMYYGVTYNYILGNLYVTYPLLYVAFYILLAGFMAGIWATVGVSLSFFAQNRFIVMICPYLFLLFVHVFWQTVGELIGASFELSPIYFIIPRQIQYNNNVWVILSWILAILLIDFIAIKKRGMKADVL